MYFVHESISKQRHFILFEQARYAEIASFYVHKAVLLSDERRVHKYFRIAISLSNLLHEY
jgi:hypothetical protein